MKSSITEAVDQGHYAEIAALAYLQCNDFSHLHYLRPRLISAKDGSRQVIVWIDFCPQNRPNVVIIPCEIVEMACSTSSRLDVLKFWETESRILMKHVFNVLMEN